MRVLKIKFENQNFGKLNFKYWNFWENYFKNGISEN